MIDQVDRSLCAWIKSILPEADIVLAPPHQFADTSGVSIYLLSLVKPPAVWMNRQPASPVALRYLVTTWATDDMEAHRLLGTLVFAALDKREYELDLEELPATLWTALNIAPRPSCVLTVPLTVERIASLPPLVQKPLVVHSVAVMSMKGVVLGPGDRPIADARVELPSLGLSSHTDAQGRFFFSTIPAERRKLQMLVRARKQTQSVLIDQLTADKGELIVCFDSFSAK